MTKKDEIWLKQQIREALIRARTERQHGETMEEALVRELAARGLQIVEKSDDPTRAC